MLSQLKTMYRTAKYTQWKNPKRLLINKNGIVIWKWCGIFFPLWNIYIGNIEFAFDIYDRGFGFKLWSKPLLIDICIRGYIGGFVGRYKLRIRFLKKTYKMLPC